MTLQVDHPYAEWRQPDEAERELWLKDVRDCTYCGEDIETAEQCLIVQYGCQHGGPEEYQMGSDVAHRWCYEERFARDSVSLNPSGWHIAQDVDSRTAVHP